MKSSSDRVQRSSDRLLRSSDRVQSSLDRVQSSSDRVQSSSDRVLPSSDCSVLAHCKACPGFKSRLAPTVRVCLLSDVYRVHIFLEMKQASVSAHSAGAYTATLRLMVNIIKGGGRAPPTLTSQG